MEEKRCPPGVEDKPYRRDSDMAPGFSMAKILLSNALPRSLYFPGDDTEDQEP